MKDLLVKYGNREKGEAISDTFIGKCKIVNIFDDYLVGVIEDTLYIPFETETELLQCSEDIKSVLILASDDKRNFDDFIYVLIKDMLLTLSLEEVNDKVLEELVKLDDSFKECEEGYFAYYDLISVKKIEW